MPFGRGDVRSVRDPIFEPMWAGRRALARAATGEVVLSDERGEPYDGFDEVRASILGSLRADEAIVDGYLFPGRFPDTTGRESPVGLSAVMTPAETARQFVLGGGGARAQRRAEQEAEAARRVTLDPAATTSFVAIDLLWLDGESLIDVPLAERKRLLESALDDADLVRRTVAVREPVGTWFAQWRALGFREYAIKGANSRYTPGPGGEGWASALIPKR